SQSYKKYPFKKQAGRKLFPACLYFLHYRFIVLLSPSLFSPCTSDTATSLYPTPLRLPPY
ncbi:hypothetical protein, partial [Bacteroides zhangwenhongii]|uniref:hypothetical protein n=1 Tax=Bacteroides zhangwenhongii TaxID=2650157 RepID=UPI0022E3C2B7